MDKIAEWVGGALVSAIVERLVDRFASPVVVNYLLGKKDSDFDGHLKKLKMMMSSLAAVLDDAEQRQIRNDSGVEAWLDDVQEALFGAEDLLDEIEIDAHCLKIEAESGSGTRKRKWSNFLFGSGSSSNGGRDMEGRVEKLVERLEEILKEKDYLGLRELNVEKEPWRRLPSTSLVDESEVYGRDNEKAKMRWLLSNETGREKICVIPIVGMGGLGKTTLAQAVFNEYKNTNWFNIQAWVCVSEEFDIFRVTKSLLQSIDSSFLCYDSMELEFLQTKLSEKLAGKKLLIVLDDVWNEDDSKWEKLRLPFKDCARGSKIIVSTRSDKVASVMGTVPSHQLIKLSDEACWKLFIKHASGVGDFTLNPQLVRFGKVIVGKCKGLPLAVKTLGGVMRSTLNVQEWERVSNSEIWELTDVQSKILPALKLSYHYLPSPLKRCFAYCSIFPKDYEIKREELILLWMSDSLLVGPNKNKRMEDVGNEYFDDLVSRSFLQQLRTSHNESIFVIHDLLVDLAKSVSKKYCFLLESGSSFDKVAIKQARHLAYVPGVSDANESFNSVFGATHLRTIIPTRSMFSCVLPKNILDAFFVKLKYLRSLSLSGYSKITHIPDSIVNLRHLRFLDLSYTLITCLPDSICFLYKLQSLILSNCKFLLELPIDIHRLVDLRYLNATSSGLKGLPESLCSLSNLRTLKLGCCLSLSKLPESIHHLVDLRFLDVNSSGLKEVPESLSLLSNLHTLILSVCRSLTELPENIHHLVDLRYLDVNSSGLKQLPESLSQLSNLHTLNLSYCRSLTKLPESIHCLVGLRYLYANSSGLKELPESFSLLSNLRSLSLSECRSLTKLPESIHRLIDIRFLDAKSSGLKELPESLGLLSNLRSLNLSYCISLTKLPESIHCLVGLRYLYANSSGLKELPESFSLLSNLRSLSLSECRSLTKLPESTHHLVDLRYLNVNSSGIKEFPESLSLLPNMHTLNLSNCRSLTKLPDSIHSLVDLRYLDVSSSGLEELPESLSLLSNLHTLNLSLCRSLTKLPKDFHRLPNLRKLEVRDSGIEGMPLRMSELKSIRSLDVFIVGNDIGAGIGELGSLSDLGGTLRITNLQRVVRPEDASEARLRDKKHLVELILEWENIANTCLLGRNLVPGVSRALRLPSSYHTSVHENDIFDCLMPSMTLKWLTVTDFGGTQLPSWLGHHSFCKLTNLSLYTCKNCACLPSFGQLPFLRRLLIKGFDSVVRVGYEFFGNTSLPMVTFALLEKLEISEMPNWKEWSIPEDCEVFPKLRELILRSCGNLTGVLPTVLPSLNMLDISECNQLASPFPSMLNVDEIRLKSCQNLCRNMDPNVWESFGCLRSLYISSEFPSLLIGCLPAVLKTLTIEGRMDLEFQLQQPNHSLESLSLTCWNSFFVPSFTLDYFLKLRMIHIFGCSNLESLWTSPSSEDHQSLLTLKIVKCHDRTLFPTSAPPFPNLTLLSVDRCEELKFLSEIHHDILPCLESLLISECPSLKSYSMFGLPSSLNSLSIRSCDELVASRMNWNLQRLTCLTQITINSYNGSDMETFPDEGLFPASISKIYIMEIRCLTTLENSHLRQLTSLKSLSVINCPNLEIMTEGRLPGSLLYMGIRNCPLIQEKCKEEGEFWDKISHVLHVNMF